MKSLLELYGNQFRNPMLNSDSGDYTTADVFGQMGANKRRAEYDNSLLGMVHNWASGEQRQPVQLPDDASWMDQLGEAGMRLANLPNDMAAGGAKTMAHWLGAAGNPEMVEPLDMLAPLGIGAMAGMVGAVPRGAVGSAGGKLASDALDMSHEARMARAKEMGFDTDTPMYKGYYPYESGGPVTNWKGEFIRDDGPYVMRDELSGFMSPDPNIANRFSGVEIDANGVPHQLYDNNAVAKLFARTQNPLTIDAKGKFAGSVQFEQLAKRDGMLDEFNKWKRAKDDGYDSVIIKNTRDEGDITQVFDPKNIRSVNAAFDPSKADSANLLAADQARGSLPGLLAGAADEPKGITAYHGSPHDFDKFSLDKIGTGEGAQAYGHGLYFAENEGVAKSYRDNLAPRNAPPGQNVALGWINWHGDKDKAAAALKAEIDRVSDNADVTELKQALAHIETGSVSNHPGRIYEVRINADPEYFLDWDKPLSQQSEKVRGALRGSEAYAAGVAKEQEFLRRLQSGESIFPATPERVAEAQKRVDGYADTSAADFVHSLPFGRGSEQLREAGIPGIRYLDQGSRTAGEGSRNYVVFDDALVEILRKYGLLGMIGGGSLLGSSESEASPAGGGFGVP